MRDDLLPHWQTLLGAVESLDSVLVLLSGGVDSAVLALAAAEALGPRAALLTVSFEAVPGEEVAGARAVAARTGLHHEVAGADILGCEAFASNPDDRCFHCKGRILAVATAVRERLGLRWIVDGTNTDDLGDHRPGMEAARQAGVRHPHLDAGLGKSTLRALARDLGLEAWDRPSAACLATRLPPGTRITADKLHRVGTAERALEALGLRRVRVRWHELEGARVMARIEVDRSEIALVADEGLRSQAVAACRAAGFDLVTLDLTGYRGEPLPP